MRIIAYGISLLMLTSANAHAGVDLPDPSSELHAKCLAEAKSANEIKTIDDQIYYTCVGVTAKNWYEISGDEKAVHDKNGIFIARYYGESGYCAHQIEDSAGKAVSSYVCEIVVKNPQ